MCRHRCRGEQAASLAHLSASVYILFTVHNPHLPVKLCSNACTGLFPSSNAQLMGAYSAAASVVARVHARAPIVRGEGPSRHPSVYDCTTAPIQTVAPIVVAVSVPRAAACSMYAPWTTERSTCAAELEHPRINHLCTRQCKNNRMVGSS